jgi:ABC-type multidrug transport system fused ATPase/permease subunit
MRTLTQAFQIIKIIKLYSWENYFTNKITNERNEELKYFKKTNLINVFINCIFWLTGPIMSFVSICAYNFIYDKMNLSNILTGLFIFYLLGDPLFLLPEYLNGLVDSILSLKRIEIFLNKKEYNPKELVININPKEDEKLAIEIDGLDFGIIKKREEFEKEVDEIEDENEENESDDSNKNNKIKKNIVNNEEKEIELKDIDLSKCEVLESIIFNMTGISFFVDFSKLPINSLKSLDIEISSLRDLKSINEGLKSQKDKFKKLTEIRLNICINIFEDIFDELLKIFENIPFSVKNIKITIENIIGKSELYKILKAYHRNIRKEQKINCLLDCNSKELEGFFDESKIKLLKDSYNAENGFFINKCELKTLKHKNQATIIKEITFSLVDWPEKNIMESIINSFTKSVNEYKDFQRYNKNIFSRIFSFIGNTHELVLHLDQK